MARAQSPMKLRRLGVLSQTSAGTHPTPLFQGFLQGLRELGWVDGHNLVIEWRFSEGSIEPLPRLAAELAAVPVELIVASPAAPARAAKEATGTIPVVFIQVPDPVGLGIVANLARPGANITGLSSIASDLTGKRLALVKEVLPDATRIALLWNRPSEGAALWFARWSGRRRKSDWSSRTSECRTEASWRVPSQRRCARGLPRSW
jgi:putative tryptophan/tyrosine transport system substrate-binding protein